jgi:hypothetical protein
MSLQRLLRLRERQRLWSLGTRKNIVVDANSDTSKKLSVKIINHFLIPLQEVENLLKF